MADAYKEFKTWISGVVSSAESDIIPDTALSHAENTAFRKVGLGTASIGSRPGMVEVNATPFGSAILGFQPYTFNDSGTFRNYLATITADGAMRYKQDDDTFTSALVPPTNYPFSASTAFSAGDFNYSGVVMGNRLFVANTNNERRAMSGQDFTMFGHEPLATWAASNVSGGSASMPDEAYTLVLTTSDPTEGDESSRTTEKTVTLTAGQRIRVQITPTAEESARYTHYRIYLRRDTTQDNYFRVLKYEDSGGSAISVTDGDVPLASADVYIDLTSAEIADNILPAPNTTENNPPPNNIRYLATYGNRLVGTCRENFYWSKLNQPTAFPPENFEPIESGTGDEITGVAVYTSNPTTIANPFGLAQELMLIFTRTSVWGVYGNEPASWKIRVISRNIGCVAHSSISSFGSVIMWWSEQHGPVYFDGEQVRTVGTDLLGPSGAIDALEPSRRGKVISGIDIIDERVVFSFSPPDELSRNTRMMPYSWQDKVFEATYWDGMDTSALCMWYDKNGRQRLFIGNYAGQVLYFDSKTYNDGVDSGTLTGAFTPLTGSITTIAGTGFRTAGAGLVERYVSIHDSTGRAINRVRISANTATQLTLAKTVYGLSAAETYTFNIAAQDVKIYTKWIDMDQAFLRKRFDRLYLQARSVTDPTELLVATQVNFADERGEVEQAVEIAGAEWDQGIWDFSNWAGTGLLKRRLAVMRNAHALRVAIFHYKANSEFTFIKLALLARVTTDRYYR